MPRMTAPLQKRAPLRRDYTMLVFVVVRVFVALTQCTRESADEWWQSTEVAYRLVFGKGQLTWEWVVGIRSVVFPLLFAAPMYALKLIGCDTAFTIWAAPRVVQACIAAAIDGYVMRICHSIDAAIRDEPLAAMTTSTTRQAPSAMRRSGADERECVPRQAVLWPLSPSVAQTAFWLQLLQWYTVYDGVRCYSNIAEALFVLAAFTETRYVRFLVLAALACMVRVTSVFALLPMFAWHVHRHTMRRGAVRAVMYCGAVGMCVATAASMLLVLLDYQLYGRLLFTPWRFAQFNIVAKVSQHFGTHTPYWYVTAALPAILGPHTLFLPLLPYVLMRSRASWRVRARVLRVAGLLVWLLLCHSLVAHKEMRFIFATLPLCVILVSYTLSCVARAPQSVAASRYRALTQRGVRVLHAVFLLVNVVLIVFSCYVYRRGANDFMSVIRSGSRTYTSIDILLGSYDTPGYSYVHKKVHSLNTLTFYKAAARGASELFAHTENTLYALNPMWFVLWRYERRLPVDALPHAQAWLRAAAETMGADTPPRALPEGMLLPRDVADELLDNFLARHKYACGLHLYHGPRLANEDVYDALTFCVRT